MKHLKSFEEFIEELNESASKSNQLTEKYRMQKLADIPIDNLKGKYCILISVGESEGKSLITEHEQYQGFQKTTNRYVQHPENPDIPVQAHYHIYPSKGKKEIYAVNMDGTAHHKKNRGYGVPKKEADELRKMGVEIPDDRIIENREIDFSGFELDQVLLLIE
ncbi:MAG: hypothetical protein RBR97_13615 [Bacteroidales bacterium]|nr:hypothetical protein [Bacteroidales bacterium]